MTKPMALDSFDRHILRLYQSATLNPAQLIGEQVGLSAAAVQRRLKRLRETGVIQAEIAQIDPAAIGLPVTVITHVNIALETRGHIDAFKAQMRKLAQVQQCWYTTGDADFVLVVRVASMEAYEAFTREAFLHDGSNVAKFTSYVVLNEIKSGLSLAIPE
jgi:Lrp/AsnC family transcriptional regulator, leucine-responsive regulatory protein